MKENEIQKNRITPTKVLEIYRRSPGTAAAISKLVQGEDNSTNESKGFDMGSLGVEKTNKRMIEEKADIANIFRLFPEFRFVADVVTTMTLASADKGAYTTNFKLENNPFPNDINSRVLTAISSHMEKNYKITDGLYKVTYECLFGAGSYAETIIPENVLDDIIASRVSAPQVSVEGDDDFGSRVGALLGSGKNHGFLGNPSNGSVSMENDEYSPYVPAMERFPTIEVTDNWNVLKTPDMKRVEARDKAYEAMGVMSGKVSMEDDLIFRKPQNQLKADVLRVENLNLRDPIGKPSITKINSEAIIPIFLKSKPEEHIAYFILIDEEGLPVSKVKEDEDFSHDIQLASGSVDFNGSAESKKLSKAAKNLGLMTDDAPVNNEVVQKFSELIEEDFSDRLKSGIHGGLASFDGSKDLYEIMLRKTLKNMGCKMLYMPAEMLQYTALDYRQNGTGKSLMQDVIMVASMRAALMMSSVNNEIQNNITTTIVDIALDPNDKSPEKTYEMIKAYVLKMKENNMHDFTIDPTSINDWLSSIGVRFQISEHPRLPNVKIDFSTEETSKPDTGDAENMMEKLTKSMILSVGLMPEILDNIHDSTYASISEANRVLMDRRNEERRKVLMQHVTSKVKKIMRADEELHKVIIEVLEDNKISLKKNVLKAKNIRYNKETKPVVNEWIVGLYIDYITCTLPSQNGDDSSLEEEFGKYKDSLDDRIELILGDGVGELLADLEEYREPALELWKNHLLRTWCVDNNYLPEVDDIIQTDSLGEPIVDLEVVAKSMSEGLAKSTAGFVALMKELKAKNDARLEEAGKEEEEETEDDDDEPEQPADDTAPEPTEDEPEPPEDGEAEPTEDGSEPPTLE